MPNPAAPELFFRGRPDDPRFGEVARAVTGDTLPAGDANGASAVLLGTPEDRGVTANRGRAGAASGPDSIRKFLYRLTPPADPATLAFLDYGNVERGDTLEATHARAEAAAHAIGASGHLAVFLGGGNDVTAAHVRGWRVGLGATTKVGVVNVDPHFDVRPPDPAPHSGTPYRRLIDEKVIAGINLVAFGAQMQRNSLVHRKYCEQNGVTIVDFDRFVMKRESPADVLCAKLAELSSRVDAIFFSIDLDACCECEGTSAAGVVGWTARELLAMAITAAENDRVRAIEIVEVAPPLDVGERASRIAAEVLHGFLRTRLRGA